MNYTKSALPLAQDIVEICVAKKITKIVISPGSRNAPLTIDFSNHPEIEAFSIVDERCAAFFAIGLSQQSVDSATGQHSPVALVCTSGSALLNYYPAIAEAFYSDIPLAVISADRPQHLIDVGDGQTIRQAQVFHKHILAEANLKSAVQNQLSKAEIQYNQDALNKVLNLAWEQQGPVHINVPFDEPLYGLTTASEASIVNRPSEGFSVDFNEDEVDDFIKNWNQAERKMILVGVQSPNQLPAAIMEKFAEDDSVFVFTETTSNLRHPRFFSSIDTIIAPIEKDVNTDFYFEKLRPEILLTFGGMVVSKKIKAFLRTYSPQKHYHVDAKKAFDTFFSLTHHFQAAPGSFFQTYAPKMEAKNSGYRLFWDEVKKLREQKKTAYLKSIPFSDFTVFHQLFAKIPAGEILHISNSSAIRYAQLFPCQQKLDVYCNRGTSGIDGSVSTAVGAAVAAQKPTTLITGDLSFFYDSNALWNKYIPNSFKIIVINNGGGGIFRILPGDTSQAYFKNYFETTHQLTAEHLAKMYGFNYIKVDDDKALIPAIEAFYATQNKHILEIFTPREINDQVLLEYFKAIKIEKNELPNYKN